MRQRLLILGLLITIKISANELPAYYPQDLRPFLTGKNSSLKDNRPRALKQRLKHLLESAHLSHEKLPDTLISNCGPAKRANCYQHKVLHYREAKKILFGRLHLKKNKNGFYIKDVYCNKMYGPNQENILEIGPNIIPPATELNCEHTWPQSKFTTHHGKKQQKSDLHHLFPTNGHANSIRSSYGFANVIGAGLFRGCEVSQLGNPNRKQFAKNYYFQPPKWHRGNVARAIFYFATRYDLKINSTEENFLRQWHRNDPVDDEERMRNEAIFTAQKNRNPYIDIPGLVDKIKDF